MCGHLILHDGAYISMERHVLYDMVVHKWLCMFVKKIILKLIRTIVIVGCTINSKFLFGMLLEIKILGRTLHSY